MNLIKTAQQYTRQPCYHNKEKLGLCVCDQKQTQKCQVIIEYSLPFKMNLIKIVKTTREFREKL